MEVPWGRLPPDVSLGSIQRESQIKGTDHKPDSSLYDTTVVPIKEIK